MNALLSPGTTLVAACLALAGVAGSQPSADRSRLAALWVLDEERSDQPLQRPETDPDASSRRRGGGMSGVMRGGGMGGSGRVDREEMQQRAAARQGMMHTFRENPASLAVVFRESDGAIVLTHANGRIVTMLADGRKYKEPLPDGGTADRVTRWRDGTLVTELRADDLKLTQTYAPAEQGLRLVVTSTLDMPHVEPSPAWKRVYNRDGVQQR